MSSGREVLRSLDRALNELRDEFRGLDSELGRLSADLAAMRRRESAIYQALAGGRLDALAADQFVSELDAADRRAAGLLEKREADIAELNENVASLQQEIVRLNQRRGDEAEKLDASEAALEQLLATVHEELKASAGYKQLLADVQAAVDMAANAEAKTAQSESDRRDKGRPYERDALFMYLWSRHYGTSDYRAGPFARFGDSLVARHIGYEQARRNYYMLNEIPLRLRRHTERLEARAAELMEDLSSQQRQAELAAGAEAMEAAVAQASAASAATDKSIAEQEELYSAQLGSREAYATGRDEVYVEAMRVLVENFRAEPIPQLRAEAAMTADYEDDTLVNELGRLRAERETVQQHADDRKQLHARRLQRMNELTSVLTRFKSKRFDAGDSIIDDRGNVELMLGEFMRGLVGGDRLWTAIRHSQRFRPRMRGSTGGQMGTIRIPRIPTGIRIPRGMGGGGGFKFPRMPRGGGGGGFGTKGGF